MNGVWTRDLPILNAPIFYETTCHVYMFLFLAAICLPYSQLEAILQGTVSLTQCLSLCLNFFDLKVTKSLITRLGPTFSKVWNRDLPILITIPRPTRPLSVIWLWSNYKSSGASHHSPQCEFQNNQCFVVLIKMQFCIKIKPQCKVYELKATAL